MGKPAKNKQRRAALGVKRVVALLSLFPFVLALSCTTQQPGGTSFEDIQWQNVIEGRTFTACLKLSSSYTLIRNCTFTNIHGNGLEIRDARYVWVKDCSFSNISGMGILLPEDSSSDSVTVEGCRLSHIGVHGVHVTQRETTNHTNFRLLGCIIDSTGEAHQWEGHDHGVYVQSTDFLIEGNTVSSSLWGHGISVRSSGIVRGNVIFNNHGSCIDYFNDHAGGASDVLVVENNICWDDDGSDIPQSHLIKLVWDPLHPGYRVSRFVIRFNTVVSFRAAVMAIAGDSQYLDAQVQVYGNLAVNTQGGEPFPLASFHDTNYSCPSLVGFAQVGSQPFDFHITAAYPARGRANTAPDYPQTDIDGQPRYAGQLDAGADQFYQ